jgi:hypothetical protein
MNPNVPRHVLLVFSIMLLCAPGGAFAQANQWDKPLDFKQLVPPVVPLPPNARLNAGSVGGYQTPRRCKTRTTCPRTSRPLASS